MFMRILYFLVGHRHFWSIPVRNTDRAGNHQTCFDCGTVRQVKAKI